MADTIQLKTEFSVRISCHTKEAEEILSHPEKVRFIVGAALENATKVGLAEEIDFTLEVTRIYSQK